MSQALPKSISIATSAPPLPVASAAPAAAAADLPATPALPQEHSGAADFVAQLKTALKNLTRAVTLPDLGAQLAPQLAAVIAPGAEPAKAPVDAKDGKPVGDTSAKLAEVLAELGIVTVPIAFQPLISLPEKSAAAPDPPMGVPLPTPDGLPTIPAAQPQVAREPAVGDPSVPVTIVVTPHEATLPNDVPTVPADTTPQVMSTPPPLHRGASEQGTSEGSPETGQHASAKKTNHISDGESSPTVFSPTDAATAAAAGATGPTSVTVLPPHVRPSEVVAQIAHQADLYRLPGNRGVRIQLHPEGLGGVEVTMRLGVGGALQLHINVEHADTGALVQAGWTQLRDALATQGISPDRLVMSVTAPNGSSQLDFSGGGSGRQAEPGLASFAQNQSGQQGQDTPEQPSPRGWNGATEPTSPSDDSPRVASTTAVTARIDYRA